MSEAKKIMNTAETIHITEEDKRAALEMLENIPVINIDDALEQYRSDLDSYCKKYNVQNHEDLMLRADELSFEPRECFDILDKYSFIARHQS